MIVSEQNEPSSTGQLTIMSSMIGIVDGLLTLRAYGCIWRILGIHGPVYFDLVKPNAEGNTQFDRCDYKPMSSAGK